MLYGPCGMCIGKKGQVLKGVHPDPFPNHEKVFKLLLDARKDSGRGNGTTRIIHPKIIGQNDQIFLMCRRRFDAAPPLRCNRMSRAPFRKVPGLCLAAPPVFQ